MAMLDITKSRTISPAQTFAQFLKELSVRTQLLIMKFRQLVNNISEAEYEDFKARKNSEVQDYYENLADNHKLQVEKAIERAQMRAPLFSRNVTINESRESRSNESFARQEQTEQTVPQQTTQAVRENVEHTTHPSINDLIKTGNFTEEQIASLSAKLSEIYGTEVTCRSVTGTHKGPDGTQIPNKSKFLELTMNGKVIVVNQRLNTMGHQPEGVSVPAAIKTWVNEQADIEGPDIPSEEYIAKLINYNEKQNKDTTVTLFNFPVMITHENNIYEAHGKNGETIAVAEHIEDFLPRITEKFRERLASMDTEYQEYMKERSQTERSTEIEPEKSTNIDRTFNSLVRNAFSEMESAGETSREIVAFNRRITVSKTEEGFRLHRGAMNIENPDLYDCIKTAEARLAKEYFVVSEIQEELADVLREFPDNDTADITYRGVPVTIEKSIDGRFLVTDGGQKIYGEGTDIDTLSSFVANSIVHRLTEAYEVPEMLSSQISDGTISNEFLSEIKEAAERQFGKEITVTILQAEGTRDHLLKFEGSGIEFFVDRSLSVFDDGFQNTEDMENSELIPELINRIAKDTGYASPEFAASASEVKKAILTESGHVLTEKKDEGAMSLYQFDARADIMLEDGKYSAFYEGENIISTDNLDELAEAVSTCFSAREMELDRKISFPGHSNENIKTIELETADQPEKPGVQETEVPGIVSEHLEEVSVQEDAAQVSEEEMELFAEPDPLNFEEDDHVKEIVPEDPAPAAEQPEKISVKEKLSDISFGIERKITPENAKSLGDYLDSRFDTKSEFEVSVVKLQDINGKMSAGLAVRSNSIPAYVYEMPERKPLLGVILDDQFNPIVPEDQIGNNPDLAAVMPVMVNMWAVSRKEKDLSELHCPNFARPSKEKDYTNLQMLVNSVISRGPGSSVQYEAFGIPVEFRNIDREIKVIDVTGVLSSGKAGKEIYRMNEYEFDYESCSKKLNTKFMKAVENRKILAEQFRYSGRKYLGSKIQAALEHRPEQIQKGRPLSEDKAMESLSSYLGGVNVSKEQDMNGKTAFFFSIGDRTRTKVFGISKDGAPAFRNAEEKEKTAMKDWNILAGKISQFEDSRRNESSVLFDRLSDPTPDVQTIKKAIIELERDPESTITIADTEDLHIDMTMEGPAVINVTVIEHDVPRTFSLDKADAETIRQEIDDDRAIKKDLDAGFYSEDIFINNDPEIEGLHKNEKDHDPEDERENDRAFNGN